MAYNETNRSKEHEARKDIIKCNLKELDMKRGGFYNGKILNATYRSLSQANGGRAEGSLVKDLRKLRDNANRQGMEFHQEFTGTRVPLKYQINNGIVGQIQREIIAKVGD